MAIPNYPVTDSTTGKAMPRPSRPIDYGVKTSTIISEFDAGHSQRRARGRAKNTFEFSYLALNATEYKTLRDFYIFCNGPVKSFNWVDPVTNSNFVVHFSMENFVGNYKMHNANTPLYEVGIKLEEVF